MTCTEVLDCTAEYVLGTLDDVSRARVEAHLSTCQTCRSEVTAVAKTFDALGRTAEADPPSGDLRSRIQAIPATEPRLASISAPRTSSLPPSRGASWTSLFAVAAGLVAAVALWQWAATYRELSDLRVQVAQLRVEAGDLLVARASISRLEGQLADATRQAQVLRASDLVTFTLVGQEDARGAHGRAYFSHAQGLVFTAEGLPALPAGRVYQLWVIVNAAPVSAGVFSPDGTGRALTVTGPPPVNAIPGVVAITIEPEGGVPQPTGAIVMAGSAS